MFSYSTYKPYLFGEAYVFSELTCEWAEWFQSLICQIANKGADLFASTWRNCMSKFEITHNILTKPFDLYLSGGTSTYLHVNYNYNMHVYIVYIYIFILTSFHRYTRGLVVAWQLALRSSAEFSLRGPSTGQFAWPCVFSNARSTTRTWSLCSVWQLQSRWRFLVDDATRKSIHYDWLLYAWIRCVLYDTSTQVSSGDT